MKKHLIHLIFVFTGLFISWFCSSGTPRITFKVIAPQLPDTARIFITGNHPDLGEWHPDTVILENKGEGIWQKTFRFPVDTHLEFKFTKGSWSRQALTESGEIPPNLSLTVKSDTTFQIKIFKWQDENLIHREHITGTVKYHRQMTGNNIRPRDIIVWLPPSYQDPPLRRYPVLYMHDGQNIFDPTTSFMGNEWQVDETADSLMKNGLMQEIIIIGIYNTSDRESEYSQSRLGEAYMRFIVDSLKPFIDKNYRTLTGSRHTAVMGSSMGGLISFLLAWHYPHVFHQAACLSPAFIYDEFQAVRMVEDYRGPAKDIHIYMDNGGVDLEKILQPGCDAMLKALQQKGFTPGKNLLWFYDEKAPHNEKAWAKRVWRPLLFMFGKNRQEIFIKKE